MRILIALLALAGATFTPSPADAQAVAAWAMCFGGQSNACASAGQHYYEGTGGVPATPTWAVMAWEHGCAADDGASCAKLGIVHEAGYVAGGVAPDRRQATVLYEKSCELESGMGCFLLGRLARSGRGAGRHRQDAGELIAMGCELGAAEACLDLSRHSSGEVARSYRQRACDLGHAGSCVVHTGQAIAERIRERRRRRRARREAR